MREKLILLGGGGHASVVYDAAIASGWDVIGYAARDESEHLPQLDWFGPVERLADRDAWYMPAVGDPALRREWSRSSRLANVVHPTARISAMATLDVHAGIFVSCGAAVNPRATIFRGVILNTGSVVDHDCVVGPFSHVAPGAILCGGVHVGRGVLVGAGSIVIPGCRIADEATVGAGAVVIGDVGAGDTVVGVPARALTRETR